MTRDSEIRNNLTVTKGEMGGDSGAEGFSETSIKDTWTKPRGGGKGREVRRAGG